MLRLNQARQSKYSTVGYLWHYWNKACGMFITCTQYCKWHLVYWRIQTTEFLTHHNTPRHATSCHNTNYCWIGDRFESACTDFPRDIIFIFLPGSTWAASRCILSLPAKLTHETVKHGSLTILKPNKLIKIQDAWKGKHWQNWPGWPQKFTVWMQDLMTTHDYKACEFVTPFWTFQEMAQNDLRV